jgi:hypothetical protein
VFGRAQARSSRSIGVALVCLQEPFCAKNRPFCALSMEVFTLPPRWQLLMSSRQSERCLTQVKILKMIGFKE